MGSKKEIQKRKDAIIDRFAKQGQTMSSSGDEADKKSSGSQEDDEKVGGKMVTGLNGNKSSSSELPTKRARIMQTISGTTATSVAALRRSGLRFTDVDDPNALRVQTPKASDILFGRGRGFQEHPGNQRMLKIISKHKQAYRASKRSRKREFVESVYEEITKDGSRFLKKLEGENCWVEVSIPISLEKVSHTLRGKRKSEDDFSSPDADDEGTSDDLMGLQKRHKAAVSTVGDGGIAGMPSNWLTQGFGNPMLPTQGMGMSYPSSMTNNSTAPTLQDPSQSRFAQAQAQAQLKGAAPNAASAMASGMPQALAAFGGLQPGAMGAFGNPFMLGSLFGAPQMAAGSNPLLVGGARMFGGAQPSSAFFGASNQNLELAQLQLLRQQQFMNASAGGSTNNPLMGLQGPIGTTLNLPLASQLGGAGARTGTLNPSASKANVHSDKNGEVEL